ncbi:hypothetical protein LCGC14_2487960 [marine sediment metagenome]|uniref:Uncharacterized protein n=1 Tax=marine sediment metagenome TaxID=412755 RepID=A0A0F9DHL1_9ZZZZ
MLKRLGWKRLLGLAIMILCLLLLLTQSNLHPLSFLNTSWEGATLSTVAVGGIVLGSYLVLGPLGLLVSVVALIGGGCNGGGGGGGEIDLGDPPNPPE